MDSTKATHSIARSRPAPHDDSVTERCNHCGGAMFPSSFQDEPPACIMCGRSNREQLTAAQVMTRKLGSR